MENRPPKNSKSLLVVVAVIGIGILCISCIGCFLVFGLIDDTGSINNSRHDYNISVNDISSVEDLNNAFYDFHKDLNELMYYEEKMYLAAESEDPNSFFDFYHEYNKTGQRLILQTEEIAGAMDYGPYNAVGQSGYFPFIQKVNAKERHSYWYYVPVIGSLVKAKHQSIETSRAGIYDYLKNNVESVDRELFLNEYGLNSVEDLRAASDSQVEQLARDPELRVGIDWTKITTDLGETAVKTTVEANQAVLGGENPLTPSGTIQNLAKQFATKGELDTIKDGMPKAKVTKDAGFNSDLTIGLNQRAIDIINSTAPESVGKSWGDLPPAMQSKLTDKITSDCNGNGPLIVSQGHLGTGASDNFYVTVGEWDFVSLGDDSDPLFDNGIFLNDGDDYFFDSINFGSPDDPLPVEDIDSGYDDDWSELDWGGGGVEDFSDDHYMDDPVYDDPNGGTWDDIEDPVYDGPNGGTWDDIEDPADTSGGGDGGWVDSGMEDYYDDLYGDTSDNNDGGDSTGGSDDTNNCSSGDIFDCLDQDL